MGAMMRLAIIPGVLLAIACGSVSRPAEQITLDDTHVLVLDRGGRSTVVMGDERDLFDEAVRAYERDDLPAARRIYTALQSAHPESRWRDLYAFNRGLVAMRLEDYREAARDFEAAEAWAGTNGDARDARFHLAIAWAGLGQWQAAARVFEDLLVAESAPAQRVEQLARAGICRQRAGHYDAARAHYREAVQLYRQTADLFLQYHPTWAARAQYQVGDLFAERFAQVPLLLPLERMRVDLEAKGRLLLNAQNAFLKAIRMRDHYWALAAGYRIGQAYEDFYADLHAAEVPAELDPEAREVYFAELKRHVAPLVRRAIEVYRKNLEMGRRVRAENEWIEKSEQSLKKLEALLATLPKPEAGVDGQRAAP
jgi:tetratricopeptide (TPR) repeat protein